MFPDTESGKHCLVETEILGFGIRNRTKGIRNPTNQVPLTKAGIHYLESGIYGTEKNLRLTPSHGLYIRTIYIPSLSSVLNCLRTMLRAWKATSVSQLILITSLIKQYVVKKSTCSFYPDITIFSVILRQYRYIGSLDITIPRYNDLIPLLPWHIVIIGVPL